MTERLYYDDCYLTSFRARILRVEAGGTRVFLDRTAFYPASGGQPFDIGTLGTASVVEVAGEGDEVAHVVASPLEPGDVEGHVDWDRRFDHMQQHTGQHLLSAAFIELLGAETVSFHMGSQLSTIELATAKLDEEQLALVERRANQLVAENRPVIISYEDAADQAGLRKPSVRSGMLRIVAIDRLDRSACGGTHVRATGEIGAILLRGMERIRGNVRVEFACGIRAAQRARADYNLLTASGRLLSSAVEDVPVVIESLVERLAASEKQRRKLALEIAALQGRDLYYTAPESNGRRFAVTAAPALDEVVRAQAQAFTAQGNGVLVASCDDPPSVLMAASAQAGVHAGQLLKGLLAANGGRGGGSAQMAQGSLPSLEALRRLQAELEVAVREAHS